jgi:hypothetical protein
MAYTTNRTSYSTSSRNQLQQPTYSQKQPSYSHAQEHHVYEDQPQYVNEPTTSKDSRRTGGVSEVLIDRNDLISLNKKIQIPNNSKFFSKVKYRVRLNVCIKNSFHIHLYISPYSLHASKNKISLGHIL